MKKISTILELCFTICYGAFFFLAPFFQGFYRLTEWELQTILFGMIAVLGILILFFRKQKIKWTWFQFFALCFPLFYLFPILFKTYPTSIEVQFQYLFVMYEWLLLAFFWYQVYGTTKNQFLYGFILGSVVISLLVSLIYFADPQWFSSVGIYSAYLDYYPTAAARLYGLFTYPNTFALWLSLGLLLNFWILSKRYPKTSLLLSFFLLFGLTLSASRMIFVFLGGILLVVFWDHRKEKEKIWKLLCILGSSIFPLFMAYKAFRNFTVTGNFSLFFLLFLLAIGIFYVLFWGLQKGKIWWKGFLFSLCVLFPMLFLCSPQGKIYHPGVIQKESNLYLLDLNGLEKQHPYRMTMKIENKGRIQDTNLRFGVIWEKEKNLSSDETIERFVLDQKENNITFEFTTRKEFEYYYLQGVHLAYDSDYYFYPVVLTDLETGESKEYPFDYWFVPYHLVDQLEMIRYDQGSVEGRLEIYQTVWKQSQGNRFFGQGSMAHWVNGIKSEQVQMLEEHSYIVSLFAEVGFFGMVPFLGFALILLFLFWNDRNRGILTYSLLLILASITFDFTFRFGIMPVIFYLYLFLYEKERL